MIKKALLPALLGIIGLTLVILAVGGRLDVSQRPSFVQGEIDAIRVDISAKISGRIVEQLVRDGSSVQAGDLLLVLDSPEVQARLEQAEANVAEAQAQMDKVTSGSRIEEINQAVNVHAESNAAMLMARQTFDRVKRLHDAKAISTQVYDEARTAALVAEEREKSARSVMEMAQIGARTEDHQAVGAQFRVTLALLAEITALQADTRLTAPISGQVNKVLVRQGELVSPGYPLLTLVDMAAVWAVLQVREEYLAYISMGQTVVGKVPALGNREVTFKVTYIAPMGAFATWRATNNSGSFDLKTFEIHAEPAQPVEGLRPGMSVIFSLPDNKPTA